MERHRDRILKFLQTDGPALHALLVRLTLRHEIAEELMQELFIRLYKSDSYARASDPDGYAFRTAINLAFDWRRARARNPQPARLTGEPIAAAKPPLNRLVEAEQLAEVLDAIEQLSESYRYAFVMRCIQEQPYETIAAELGKTSHQVRALCHKALNQLRALLNENQSPTNRKEGRDVKD